MRLSVTLPSSLDNEVKPAILQSQQDHREPEKPLCVCHGTPEFARVGEDEVRVRGQMPGGALVTWILRSLTARYDPKAEHPPALEARCIGRGPVTQPRDSAP